ncbi:hypothetical protein KKC94_03995 [Patescibacteria group bacterium]|nr:hypothetical protein [Patescibacteria group bacterium]
MPASHGIRHHAKKTAEKESISTIDRIIYFAVFAYPASMFPQILKIYLTKNAESIAMSSYIIMIGFALIWLSYGFKHKDKPLIISNYLWISIYIVMIAGTILY